MVREGYELNLWFLFSDIKTGTIWYFILYFGHSETVTINLIALLVLSRKETFYFE